VVSVREILKTLTPHRRSVRRRITVLSLVAAVVAATAALAAPTLGRILSFPLDDTVNVASQASNSSAVTLRYHCGFPGIGPQPMVATVQWNTPPVVQVGRPVPSLALSVQAAIPNQVVWGLNFIQVASFDGSADVDSDIRAPQGDIPEKVTLAIPRTEVPSSGSMTVPASGNTPVVTFGQAGAGTVDAGAVTMHLHGYSSSGSPKSPFDVSCTLDRGQSAVVATFNITPASAPSSAPSSSAAQAPPPSPSGAASHPATPGSGSASGSKASGVGGPTSGANGPSASSTSGAEAGASLSTSGTGPAPGSTAPTDSAPVLAAAVHASTANASDSAQADKGAAVTDWLLVALALLAVGSAGLFAASRLKKRRERTAQP